MSKKRHISLSSKWKLNREHEDYKKHKENRKQGGVGYIKEEPEIIKGKKRGKYPCKKLKGEHKWVLQEKHKLWVMDEAYDFYKCEACDKELSKPKFHYICEKCGGEENWLFSVIGGKDKIKCRKCGSYKIKKVKSPILGE